MSAVPRCSVRSETDAEPMLGTASTVRHWLLIEHDGPWGRDAIVDGRMPEGLGRAFRRLARTNGVRTLLIRRHAGGPTEPITCFAVRSGPGEAWIERARLDRLEDALGIGAQALGRGERPGLEPVEGPLFLVCTHGRRDPCCAERGRPLARALAGAFPDATWESSHIGGDRFAGNLLAFPHGLYFGRVDAADGPAVGRAYARGRIALTHYRGRSCRAMDVQAADHFLRLDRGLDGVDDVETERVDRVGDVTAATFRTTEGGITVRVRRGAGPPRRLTCHSAAEEAPPTYEPIEIEPADRSA